MTLEEQYNEKLDEIDNCKLFLDSDADTPLRNDWEIREICGACNVNLAFQVTGIEKPPQVLHRRLA